MKLTAKPIIDGKFWIVEDDGEKIGTLQKKENNKFILSARGGEKYFQKKDELTKIFGKDFFQLSSKAKDINEVREIYGYPTSCHPFNPVYNLHKKLPLFTKSKASKSLYCAGYYTIKFDKGWVKSFCPKLITVERYETKGPFKTELEMKQVLSNAKTD